MKEVKILESKLPAETQVDAKINRPSYTYDEAMKISKIYFNGEELPAKVFVDKYAMKDLSGKIYETNPEQMHRRLAKEFARVEEKFNYIKIDDVKTLSAYGRTREYLTEDSIYDLFKDFKYVIPQGSVMAMLGNEFQIGSLSNCFVLPEVPDSYGGILYADQQLIQFSKRRGGVGIDISTLRPDKMAVSNAAGSSTGAISFMERFSNSCREVAQNGRRGALMISIDISHPDVEQFIKIKQDLTKVTGANISVKITDEFMLAVKNDTEYTHKWPIGSENPTVTKTIKARELWNTLVVAARNNAEPGLLFWDRQHKYSTSSVYAQFKNVGVNPCAEIAMGGNDSCRLIALNMYSFVNDPFTKDAKFDFDKWYKTVYEAQRLMDNLVELELEAVLKIMEKIKSDPEPDHVKQIELETWQKNYEFGKNGRRTGLGFTALADTIAALGFKYDSEASLKLVDKIMSTKLRGEFDSSIDMSIERGSFVGFDKNVENTSEFVQMMQKDFNDVYDRMMTYGRRNISISTVAPTGTVSIEAETSSGLEPVFMLSYKRRKKINPSEKEAKVDFIDEMGDKWQEFVVYHPKLKTWMDISGETDENKSPYAGSTANEINWSKRIEMQSIIQKYTTHGCSSTLNLPNTVTVEEVGEIYMKSWEMGLKGTTVYRDGSRSGVLVAVDAKKETASTGIYENNAPKRPKVLECDVIRFTNKGEKWIGFIGLFNEKPYEIFTGKADNMKIPNNIERGKIRKTKTDESKYDFVYFDKDGNEVVEEWLNRAFDKHYFSYAKLISGILRHGMPLPYVVDLINSLTLDDDVITTWKAGVARMIKRYIPDGTKAADKKCKECKNNTIIYQEGCLICQDCGSSKCG